MKVANVLAAGFLMAAAGCQEPPRMAQMDDLVSGLAHLRKWDPAMQAKGQHAYDSVMGYGPEIYPVLVAHLTDETPTQIYEEVSDRNPKVADVVFMMLLQLTKTTWQDFSKEGVFISTVLPNPIYCIMWNRTAKFKVQAKFRLLLEALEHP